MSWSVMSHTNKTTYQQQSLKASYMSTNELRHLLTQ